ncbi:MAG: bifunctional 4-hydroxy-2-oxoglutarate aldolase/2-dehydro-3-deoxy-phosphogluconate aldolase [Chitinophagaceae bacterium]|nr:MAG: bifunctional 4-hydroxy-2-oxoglutarate aldolase/2-dehydro-3-deoxy-phosphogluconate aldolase [Chitinophagaceae bacterium]
MDKRTAIINTLKEQGLMPLYFHKDPDTCIALMNSLYKAGVRLIEFTNRGEEALANFKLMKAAAQNMEGLFIGIGTIKTSRAAEDFIDAGADFLISPALAEDVYDAAYSSKTLWIPGCMTPTEILKAENLGVELVKLFPGNVLGPGYVSAIKDLFPNMLFMPTGGVETSHENLSEWFASGVIAVGMGSKLITKKLLEEKNYTAIQQNAAEVLSTIQSIKN